MKVFIIYEGATFAGALKFTGEVDGKFYKMQYMGYSYHVARKLFFQYLKQQKNENK